MSVITIDTDKVNRVSTTIVGKFFDCTAEYVRQLGDEGYLSYERNGNNREFDLIPTVNTYIDYLKNKANKVDLNLSDEERRLKADADWKEAKADIEAMKRDELRGSLHSSDDVYKITSDMVMAIRAELLALPGMCAVDCANVKTASEVSGIIKNAVNDVLNRLTEYEYNPEKYKELVRERETWIGEDNES